MEKRAKIILIGAAVLLYINNAVNRLKQVKVWMQSASLKSASISKDTATLLVKIGIKNPLIVSVPVHSIYGTIGLDGTQVATIDQTYDDTIKANSTTYIPIEIDGSISAAMTTINNAQVANIDITIELGKGNKTLAVPVKTDADLTQQKQ